MSVAPLIKDKSAFHFVVLGRPQPAGSKRAFLIRKAGEVKGVAVTEDAKHSRTWRQLVQSAATDALGWTPEPDTWGYFSLAGPLVLEATFYVARPAGHFGTGRNAGVVRASAPRFPTVRPDATKLVRALEDALTGLVWRDDAQVVSQHIHKRFGTPERAEVTVSRL